MPGVGPWALLDRLGPQAQVAEWLARVERPDLQGLPSLCSPLETGYLTGDRAGGWQDSTLKRRASQIPQGPPSVCLFFPWQVVRRAAICLHPGGDI